MARKRSAVDAAAERIAILREIVGRERARAEANPDAGRNIKLGITEEDQPRDEARARIAEVFDESGYLIDHLSIAHMAASFEEAAIARMATVIGESRRVIEKARKSGMGRWPANLVRDADSFEGLHDIGTVLALDDETRAAFGAVRLVRNRFSHGAQVDAPPPITSDIARETLLGMLDRLK